MGRDVDITSAEVESETDAKQQALVRSLTVKTRDSNMWYIDMYDYNGMTPQREKANKEFPCDSYATVEQGKEKE